MRFLLYAINYAPELTGCGKYTSEMARWLAEHGHDVDVVTAPPYYPDWKVFDGYRAGAYATEHEATAGQTIRVMRSPLYVPARVTGKTRLLHLASFALGSLPQLVRGLAARPDVVFVVLPTMASVPALLALCALTRRRTWAHVQDFELDAALGLGVLRGGALARLAYRIERALLRGFGRVSSITRPMVDRLATKGVPGHRSLLFPNWVDLSTIFPLEGPNTFRVELGVQPEDIVLLYSGNMGEKQGLEVLIDAARLLQDQPHIHFVLAGNGAARERLQVAAGSAANIRWLPLQPAERLNLMLNAADIHLLPQRGDAADLVMPSKLTGMLASARAIVGTAAAETQLGRVLDEVGVRVQPEDPRALAAAIAQLAGDAARRAQMGRLARRYAEEHLDRDAIMGRMVRHAADFVGGIGVQRESRHNA